MKHIHQVWATNRCPTILATLFYQPSLQHFSTGPFCNMSQSTTLLYNPSLRHFSTTLFPTLPCATSLQHFPQHFSLSNTSFFATTPLPQNDDYKTTTQKPPLQHNTTLTRHSTTPAQRRVSHSSTLSTLRPKHSTTLHLESGPNLPDSNPSFSTYLKKCFFPSQAFAPPLQWPSPGPSSSPPSPRTSHWPSWLRGAPHSSRARPSRLSNPSHRWLDHGPTSGGSPLHRWAKRKNEGFWNPGCVD